MQFDIQVERHGVVARMSELAEVCLALTGSLNAMLNQPSPNISSHIGGLILKILLFSLVLRLTLLSDNILKIIFILKNVIMPGNI